LRNVGLLSNLSAKRVNNRYSKVRNDSKVVKCANWINPGENAANATDRIE
jgi:hypothetical protein